MAWVGEAWLELVRLEAALAAAPDSSDRAVQLALAGMIEVWGRCPVPSYLAGETRVHVLVDGVWETERL